MGRGWRGVRLRWWVGSICIRKEGENNLGIKTEWSSNMTC